MSRLNQVRIEPEIVRAHERMLTGGFYVEVILEYDATIAQESGGRPFGVENLREIQLSKRDVLDRMEQSRELFTTKEWKQFLLRSIGLEPSKLAQRAQQRIYPDL